MTPGGLISRAYLTAHHRQWLESLSEAERFVLFQSREFWERFAFMPVDDNWLWHGWIGGRGSGKSWSAGHVVQGLVESGKVRKLALIAQDELRAYEVCVATLQEIAPAWCKPELYKDQLHWPNGAVAYVYTPESPEMIRGPSFDLSWATEISFWRAGVAVQAWDNLLTATRPIQRIVWDSTSKGASPLIRKVLEVNAANPDRYRIIRGSMLDNPMFDREYIQLESIKYGGPGARRFEEEVNGAVYDSEDGAAFTSGDIEASRVYDHPALDVKIVGIDPAITTNAESDATGMLFGGRDRDGNGYALRDLSGRWEAEKTCDVAIGLHATDNCAGAIVEMNRGGDYLIASLKATARSKGLDLHVLESDDKFPRYTRGKYYVRKVTARQSKLDRAIPVATSMRLGQVHIVGALPELERELYTYDGSGLSPNRFDAFNALMCELCGLDKDVTLASNRQKRTEQARRMNDTLANRLVIRKANKSVI